MGLSASDILKKHDASIEGRTKSTGFDETDASKSGRESADMWVKGALPMAGAAAGAVAGPAVASALGLAKTLPYAPAIGEMIGGGLGEAGNQAAGITEPSGTAIALNTVAPGVGRLIPAAIQKLPTLLPGSTAAIRAGLVDRAREAPGLIHSPGVSYDKIPRQGQTGDFRVTALDQTGQTVAHLQNELQTPVPALTPPEYGKTIQPLLEQLDEAVHGAPAKFQKQAAKDKYGRTLPQTGLPKQPVKVADAKAPGFNLDEVLKVKEGLGKLIQDTPRGTLQGAYKQLYRSLLEDLENLPAPAGTAVDTWKQAQTTYKRELARADLAEVIERKGIKSVEGVDQFQADPVINWMKTDEKFQQRVSQADLKAIEKELRNLASFTGKRSNKLLSILAGTAMSGTAAGAAAGYVGADVIASALLNPTSRKLLTTWVTAGEGKIGRDAAALLSAASVGALGNSPETPPTPSPKPRP